LPGYFNVDFFIDFYPVKARIDLEGLFRISNWHHVVDLSFCDSGWLGDSDWRVLVECAANFRNLKRLELSNFIACF
jgi:5'-3' exonuclease